MSQAGVAFSHTKVGRWAPSFAWFSQSPKTEEVATVSQKSLAELGLKISKVPKVSESQAGVALLPTAIREMGTQFCLVLTQPKDGGERISRSPQFLRKVWLDWGSRSL